nr:hypothetical protein [Sphingomonas sp.]
MTAELGGRPEITRAANLVKEAIELLDAAGAPSDIAAHLDLAAARLEDLSEPSTATDSDPHRSDPRAGF